MLSNGCRIHVYNSEATRSESVCPQHFASAIFDANLFLSIFSTSLKLDGIDLKAIRQFSTLLDVGFLPVGTLYVRVAPPQLRLKHEV